MSVVLQGRVTPEGLLELGGHLPLPPGPVRISIEAVGGEPTVDEADLGRRRAQMDAAIGCLSDEEAARILECVEQEFEQVNPDEWR